MRPQSWRGDVVDPSMPKGTHAVPHLDHPDWVAAAELPPHLVGLWMALPSGRDNAIPGAALAREVGCSERTLRSMIDDLVDHGYLAGSTCSGERPGYFRIVHLEDLRLGTAHLVSRARSLFARVSRLRRAARERFVESNEQLLFDLFDLTKEDVP